MSESGQDTPRVAYLEVDRDQSGQRLDNFLMGQLKGVPKSRVYRLVRRGEVRVNGGRVRPHYRLKAGDRVRIPPVRTGRRERTRVPDAALDALRSAVLHEDRDFIVLNKPAGRPVHAGSGVPWGVIEAFRQARPQDRYLELGHRLDRDTSGCLALARNRAALRRLRAALREPESVKRYLLLVRGGWPEDVHRVSAPLRRVERGGERMVVVDAQGRPAATRFRVLERYPGATFLEALLETGRTHQIRVHAAHQGHPVAGDPRYGDPEFNQRLRGLGLKRPFLHAQSLSLPLDGTTLDVESPLPEALRAVLAALSPAGDSPGPAASG